MSRKIYYWKLRDSEMQLGERTLLMGVLNVTPDSFSDGGRYNDPDRAYARALELEEQGADIIDIGAESTKPGSQRITPDEEWQRLVPVLKRLRGNLRVPLSIDTYKSEIAERALEYGVEIFNDPSGLTFDPNLAKVAATGNAGLILNHMRGAPETWAKLAPMKDLLGGIGRELEATASRARLAGVERGRIIIDPGLGFGKRKEQNAEILAHLQQLAALDYPILVGPSRKSFLAKGSEAETLYASAAAVTAAVLNGAHIIRVHDVKEMQAAIQVAEEIARAAVVHAPPVEPERTAVRARSHSGPNFEAERPRPTRPPIKRIAPVIPPVTETPADPVVQAAGEEPLDLTPTETTPTIPIEKPPVEKTPIYKAPIYKAPIEKAPEERPKRVFTRPIDKERSERPSRGGDRGGDSRPPRAPYPDRDRRDGSRPPSRSFTPRGPSERSGPPPRGRDFRPGQDARSERPAAGGDRFKPTGPKRPYSRDDDRRDDRRDDRPPRSGPPRNERGEFRPARSGPPRNERGEFRPARSGPANSRGGDARPPYKPSGFKPTGPKRSFDRGAGPKRDAGEGRSFDRPARSAGPPRSGPPRSGPPRSGPPRSGPPRGDRPDRGGPSSGPPKRPFRKRP